MNLKTLSKLIGIITGDLSRFGDAAIDRLSILFRWTCLVGLRNAYIRAIINKEVAVEHAAAYLY